MDINFKKHIIYPALQIIKTDSKIKRFYFFPGTISVIFLSGILVYQVIYTYVILLGNEDAILEYLLSFVHSDYTVPL